PSCFESGIDRIAWYDPIHAGRMAERMRGGVRKMKLKPGLAAGLAGALAGAGITGAALPARANFENEVTVHGTAVTGALVSSTRLSISVERAAPELTVNVTADPAQEVTAGDRVQLTYRIVNSGNVTLDNLRLQVEQEGHGAAPVLVRVE